MDYKNSYFKFDNKEDRLEYWKNARIEYTAWRKTEQARKMINRKRKKQQGLCFWCVKQLGDYIHVDHIFPLYLGGSNGALNMCISHPKCNMDKGAEVYISYKEAGKRRRRFNLKLKAMKAKQKLAKNPKHTLSKKDLKALKLSSNIKTY